MTALWMKSVLRFLMIGIALMAAAGCGKENNSDSGAPAGTGTSSSSVEIVDCATAASPAAIAISGSAYNPQSAVVSVNGFVKWTNQDGTNHTVTSNDGKFDSGILGPGATVCMKFLAAGSYEYHCSIHPGMTGTVTAQ